MKSIRELLHFPYVVVWAAALLLLAPVYLAGKAIFWGTPLLQFTPWWTQAWNTLFAGYLPLWDRMLGMGAPLLANYQSGLLYPPYWIYALLYSMAGSQGIAWGMAPVAALHLAWSGLGMAVLARRLSLGATSQVVSGLAFGLSGYLVARLGFLSINAAASWLPWILLFITPGNGKPFPDRQQFPWLAACAALLLLAGHAQTAWYILLLGGLWCVFWAWNRPYSAGDRPFRSAGIIKTSQTARAWAGYGLAVLLAAGIAAAQLLPTAEYLAQSQRAAAVEYDFALNYSFWPWHLLTFLAPGLFGSPASGDYWGYANIWEDAVYVGLLPLLLAIRAMIASLRRREDRRRRTLIWFLLALFIVSLFLAMGKFTPIFPWLYFHVPTFDMFQAPARWMLWGVFSLALLAGLGAERWRRPQGWGLYWTRLGTMGAAAISLGAGLAWIYLGAVSPSFIRSTALLGFLGVGAGVLSLSAPPADKPVSGGQDAADKVSVPQRGGASGVRQHLFQFSPPTERARPPGRPYILTRWQWGVALFVALDLLISGWGLNPGESLDLYDTSPAAERIREQIGTRRLYIPHQQEEWIKYVRFMRFETFDPGEEWLNLRRVILPNTNLLDDIPMVNNFDPLVPGRYADWIEMLEQAFPQSRNQMLEMMNIGAIMTLDRSEPNGVQVDSVQSAWVWFVPCAQIAASPAEARQLVLSGELDLSEQVILEDRVEPQNGYCTDADLSERTFDSHIGRIERMENFPNRSEIDLSAVQPGWLVISEVWYPGWQAALDGNPVPLMRANYLFQAVRVDPGEHSLTLIYRPFSFYAGAAISLVSLFVLAAIWWRMRGVHG